MRTSLAIFFVAAHVLTAHAADTVHLTGDVVDAATGKPVAARVYLQGADGGSYFVKSEKGSAVTYDKTNWINARSVEKHTSVSAHPFHVDLPPGKYSLVVERGKEYFPETKSTDLSGPTTVRVSLRRWANLAERGWYSGETHIHRTLEELPTVVLAEDLNVAFPLTYWVTKAFTPPTAGDKNIPGAIPDKLIEVDSTHVIWPRNTEYEIFTVGPKQHTLGALFVIGHKSAFGRGFPPIGPVADQARAEGALLDMDKLDWPFGMTLTHASGATLYELTNNHLWRTEFAFKDWNSESAGFLQPPRGSKGGTEREWLHYTLGQYYTLLDAGFKMVPSAGTANGVHPVPAGFGRVYVHLPNGFKYDDWFAGLRGGRSFVTTGPMLLAELNGKSPGETIRPTGPLRVTGTIQSEHPLAFAELVANGRVVRTFMPQNKVLATGARETSFAVDFTPESSGWVCVRCFEDRPDGRVRFAHTAPWWVDVPGQPLRPRREEKEYLVRRVRDEIARSKDVLPPECLAEYRSALARFEKLEVRPDDLATARPAKDEALRAWLDNMVRRHGYTPAEVRTATGLGEAEIRSALEKWSIRYEPMPARKAGEPLVLLPYPGGRHPRIGFPDGALDPQRETKVSVFAPWADGGYAVVDVPEAIWSNLGLTYLAHTHVPTIWDKVKLPPLEWTAKEGVGELELERRLPNGITIGARVKPDGDVVRMELSIANGTKEPLTNLRAQVCAMLKGLTGFNAQTGTNKVTRGSVVACRNEAGTRWVVTAWAPLHRAWNNPPVPCLHADPSFGDCGPGQTVRARGVLLFHEGKDVEASLRRAEKLIGEKR